jgi:two-component system, NtrC family, nitrogen regulation response regulator GlnG
VMAPGNVINVSDLPAELNSEPVSSGSTSSNWQENLGREVSKILLTGEANIFKDYTNIFEKELIIQALKYTKGRKVEAAKLLGIGRNTITRKIKELEIRSQE